MEREYKSTLSTSHSSPLPYPEIGSYRKYTSKVHKDPIVVEIIETDSYDEYCKSGYITLWKEDPYEIEYVNTKTFYKNYTLIINDEV